ncbi:MAG: hypothetical protein ACK471_04805, partial [Dolichospermum sp.]
PSLNNYAASLSFVFIFVQASYFSMVRLFHNFPIKSRKKEDLGVDNYFKTCYHTTDEEELSSIWGQLSYSCG